MVKRNYYYEPAVSEESIQKKIGIGKALTFTGIGLVGSVPLFYAGGIVLLVTGGLGGNSGTPIAGLVLIGVAYANLIAGVPFVITGGVLWGVGKRQHKKYSSNNWQLQGVLKPNGEAGLVLKF